MKKIVNGTVVDPKSGFYGLADLTIENGRIVKVEKIDAVRECESNEEVLDARGLVVAPGLVDVHVHFRDPGFTYKEDICTGANAAIKGGVTTVVLMANTKPVVDNEETLSYVLEKGKDTPIHVLTCCSITKGLKGEEIVDFEALLKNGAAGFTDDGIPILREEMIKEALEMSARYDTILSVHEENPQFITNNGVNRGKASDYYGIGGSDRQAEISMIERDLQIAVETKGYLNIQHISSKEGVELVRQAKAKSDRIHAEATPHHIALTEDAVIAHGTLAKMNPPLRTREDREAILKGLQDGTIDIIATDHAPHAKEEKDKPITEAPSGILGLETALPICITNLVNTGILTMPQLFEKLSYNPARMYHLDTGYIEEGAPADLVIFAPKESFVVGEPVSKSKNSPFIGCTLQGKIHTTICEGRICVPV